MAEWPSRLEAFHLTRVQRTSPKPPMENRTPHRDTHGTHRRQRTMDMQSSITRGTSIMVLILPNRMHYCTHSNVSVSETVQRTSVTKRVSFCSKRASYQVRACIAAGCWLSGTCMTSSSSEDRLLFLLVHFRDVNANNFSLTSIAGTIRNIRSWQTAFAGVMFLPVPTSGKYKTRHTCCGHSLCPLFKPGNC